MPSPRKLERVEPPEAAKWRRQRAVLRNLQADQKYIELIQRRLAPALEDEENRQTLSAPSKLRPCSSEMTYDDLVVRVTRDKLRLVPAEGESIAWVIRCIDHDVKAFLNEKALGPPDHEGVRQPCLNSELLVHACNPQGRSRIDGSLPFFELNVSPSSLRFDSSAMEMEYEVALDIFEGGVTTGKFGSLDDSLSSGVWKELRELAVAYMEDGIRHLQSEMLSRQYATTRTYPSTLEKEKNTAHALVRFLLYGENAATATRAVSWEDLLKFSGHMGIKLPQTGDPVA